MLPPSEAPAHCLFGSELACVREPQCPRPTSEPLFMVWPNGKTKVYKVPLKSQHQMTLKLPDPKF
jgi:hypothetical protein